MLSPGNYHRAVPRDAAGNRRFRERLLVACAADAGLRQGVLAACRDDCLFWINALVLQFNPNAIGSASEEVGPFITWPFQDEAVHTLLDCVTRRKDLVIEKSREMGASWLCLLVMDWLFLFHRWKDCLVVSRSADAVDNPGDPKCLFYKLDFVHDHLPDWLTAGRVIRRKMGYANPLLRSTITGEASTGRAGVGGRAKIMFIDEFSQIREAWEVLGRTSDTSGCRVFNGTHLGVGTAFYELTRRPDVRKVVMHWTAHPDKRRGLYRKREGANDVDLLDTDYNHDPDFKPVLDGSPTGGPFPGLRSPWYDEQCRRKGSARDVATDLDIDPKGSKEQFFNAITLHDLKRVYACAPYWEGDLYHDRDTGKPIELVPETGGPLKLWALPDPDGKFPRGRYGAGADISQGTGRTPSCLTVINGAGEKVLEYTNARIEPTPFAVLAVAVCRLFPDEDEEGAAFAWEGNGPGGKFGKQVIALGYRRVYWRVNQFKLSEKVSDTPGWINTNMNSRILLDDLRHALYSRRLVNRSAHALDECLSFNYQPDGGIKHSAVALAQEASEGGDNHADHVIADGLAWMMVKDYVGLRTEPQPSGGLKPGSMAWRRREHDRREREVAEYV